MNNQFQLELEAELFGVKNQLQNKKFLVKSTDGNYVEIKQYTIADLGVDGTFYVHKPLKGDGYVVSEASTGLQIEMGPNQGIAIGKARHKINSFIQANGKEAFQKVINDALGRMPKIDIVEEPKVDIRPSVVEELITKEEKPTDIEQAITSSLDYKNCIDIDYISDLLSIPADDIEDLILSKQLAFVNPENNLIEPNEHYLSGNVRAKLVIAEFAAKQNPKYERNVDELKKVIPETIPSALIQYSIGAAWIPLHVFEKFATGMFKVKVKVNYMKSTGKFSATIMQPKNTQILSTYGAGGKHGLEIFNATLNNQQIIVTEINEERKSVKNLDKTSAAQSMQEQMQDEFTAFIRANPEIEEETEKIYNEIFNAHVEMDKRIPTIDHYPNANPNIHLRRHQKRGVARSMDDSTLFAHVVGSGKTFTSQTTAMELRRLDMAKKVMIVVQNKTIGQYVTAFRELYPNATLLVPSKEDLSPINKPYFYQRIAEDDFDAVIMPQSQFDVIPDDIPRQKEMLELQLENASDILMRISRQSAPFEYAQANRVVKAAKRELDELLIEEEKRFYTEQEASKQEGYMRLLNFEEMNIDALLIDEFTRYKKLGFQSSLINIKGIDTTKSKRAQSCLLKMRWVQQNNHSKNTHTYTGTPISNTMAEVWTMIRFVRPAILMELGIEHFDQFAKTFGQIVPSLEQTGGGTFKIQNRFAKFQNLPELVGAFRKCTDVVQQEDISEFIDSNTIPKLFGGKIEQVVVKRSDDLVQQIKEFRELLEWYDELEGAEKREKSWIPLVVFNRAKQASIDLRLLDPTKKDNMLSKVNQAIRKAFSIYVETGLVQMMFCDLYQSPEPKSQWLDEDCTIPNPAFGVARFNLFNDIKRKLISMGVKPHEIAILTEPKYDKIENAEKLFDDANKGKVKFLLGTTERMGVGVNAQEKLIALHHIDAPQRPMDFAQRNGRIERQGNTNPFIWIITYGVEKTLDSAAFQRLSIKQKFINQIMKGNNLERVTDDAADEALMTFDEMMAVLSDSPFAQQKLLVNNRLKSERLKRDNFYAKQVQIQRNLNHANDKIERLRREYENEIKYLSVVEEKFPNKEFTSMIVSGEERTEHFGIFAEEYVGYLMNLWEASPTKTAIGFFTLNGIKVNIKIIDTEKYSSKLKMMYHAPLLCYTIPEIGIHENVYGNGVSIESNSGNGLMRSIQWKVDGTFSNPKYLLQDIEKQKEIIEELSRSMDNTFDVSKLEALEQEVEILTQKMLKEKNAPQIEQEILGVI